MSAYTATIYKYDPAATYDFATGENYDKIVWSSNELIPTKEVFLQDVSESEQKFELQECHDKRVAEYPSYADQFDTIFHEGVDEWKAQIQAVKDKYPKPL